MNNPICLPAFFRLSAGLVARRPWTRGRRGTRLLVLGLLSVVSAWFLLGCEHSGRSPAPQAQSADATQPARGKAQNAEARGDDAQKDDARRGDAQRGDARRGDAPSDQAQNGGAEDATRPAGTEEVVLAGGCFWGMEEILRSIPGVVDTEVGYAGGKTPNPHYGQVKSGTTGHAESVRVVFDPKQLPFSTLLRDWFFKMHDPTTQNRQGNDVGTQYRSAIFYFDEQQRAVAEQIRKEVDESGNWDDPVVTQIARAERFTKAEGYHQDYLQKNPGGYTCHYMRDMTY